MVLALAALAAILILILPREAIQNIPILQSEK